MRSYSLHSLLIYKPSSGLSRDPTEINNDNFGRTFLAESVDCVYGWLAMLDTEDPSIKQGRVFI